MNFMNGRMNVFARMLKARILGIKKPLFVAWALTNRCNCSCYYCEEVSFDCPEIGTDDVFLIMDRLKKAGTLRLHFTGGEPLLRDDFLKIIEYAFKKRFLVSFATNGILLPQQLDFIKDKVTSITLNIDGPQQIHDAVKGNGVHKSVLNTLDRLKDLNITGVISTALTKDNASTHCIDYILGLTELYNCRVVFQPAVSYFDSKDALAGFSPAPQQYKEAMEYIIFRKASDKKRQILNSAATLYFLKTWPFKTKKFRDCPAGEIYCRIRPDGYLCLCGWKSCLQIGTRGIEAKDVEKGFGVLGRHKKDCRGCWCAFRIELAKILALDMEALYNAYYYGKK